MKVFVPSDEKDTSLTLASALDISPSRDAQLSFIIDDLMEMGVTKATVLKALAERIDLDQYESVYCAYRFAEQYAKRRIHPSMRGMIDDLLFA